MNICTVVLTAGGGLAGTRIIKNMNVVAFAIICESTDAACTITGNATVIMPSGSTAFTNVPIALSAGQGYNSPPAAPSQSWDGVEIIATAGTVNLIMTTE